MPVLIMAFIAIFIFTTASLAFAQSYQLADQYWKQAQEFKKQNRNLDAARMLEKSAQAEKETGNPRLSNLAVYLGTSGYHYEKLGQHDKAIKRYNQALEMSRRLGDESSIVSNLTNIGTIYKNLGQYDKAIKHYQQALEIDRRLGREDGVATSLSRIGTVYKNLGQYDKAINHYQQALEIDRRLSREGGVAISLSSIGTVYKIWGQYDKAIKHYQQALEIDRRLGREDGVAIDLSRIGTVYKNLGQYDKAIKNYQQVLAINRRLGREDGVAIELSLIGTVYAKWGQYDKAIKHYQQALTINRRLGREVGVAIDLSRIGTAYKNLGQYDKAIKHFQQALEIDRRSGREGGVAIDLSNIGRVFKTWGQYGKAIKHLKESVDLKEKLRLTATGDGRRDYLASQIFIYQDLVLSYLQNSQSMKALETTELSHARLLVERLANSGIQYGLWAEDKFLGEETQTVTRLEPEVSQVGDRKNMGMESIQRVQRGLPDSTAILVYSNSDRNNLVQMLLTRDSLFGKQVPNKTFLAKAKVLYGQVAQDNFVKQRGFKPINKSEDKVKTKKENNRSETFTWIINYYRTLLTNPNNQTSGLSLRKRDKANPDSSEPFYHLSRLLYDLLILPIEDRVQDKTELIIVPDGILSFLPFEILVDANGHYLSEKYSISYTPSLATLDSLSNRQYGSDRQPLLAFGGAVYDDTTNYAQDIVSSAKQMAMLEKNVHQTVLRGSSVRNAYRSLGIGKWTNLPDTLKEVNEIAELVPGTEVVTGSKVTEARVKELSDSGELANYRVLHFATHGITVPEVPELSALVLSQFHSERGGEDGYLRMGEIAKLKLKADFVNLSACETGLGKIYGGEGVVGITQSFMLAGANGISVSLWQVADHSTALFMENIYRLVEQNGMSYKDAMTMVRRRFIKGEFGEKYRAPYYWAPFVYYGKT
jgi:tetratricopeptide (TPR) repeat protein/CHAT domain-containing protein